MRVTSWANVQLDPKQVKALMRSAGNDIKTKTQRLLARTGGGGRTYRGGGGARYRGTYKPGRYTASAPGEPPVHVTGTLRGSVRSYVYKSGEGFAVRERAFYAVMLEAGSRGGGPRRGRGRGRRRAAASARVLRPRPALERVMAAENARLQQRVERAFREGLKWRQTR